MRSKKASYQRDPDTLATYCNPRCKAPAETLEAALVNNY
jgi:hypothetical protein